MTNYSESRVLILPIDQAQPGMKLAAPVAHPESPEQELLKRGYTLESTIIRRLKDLHVDLLYVEYPALDDLDRHLEANLSPARQMIYKQIKTTIQASQARTRPGVSYSEYSTSSREMITALLSQGQHPIYMDQMSRMGGDAVGHSTAVAHMSLLLGLRLERYLIEERKRLAPSHAREVVNLGIAGMLHDMGKLKLPPEVQTYTGVEMPENEEQLKLYQSHARLSYDAIHDGVEPSTASAVLHHHQRIDGNGFPTCIMTDGTRQIMAGGKIHIFARIIAVADTYDRLASGRNSKSRRPNVQILHVIRTQHVGWLDETIVKALQSICPPYPPGSTVSLSDGSLAAVVDIDQANPYQPKIKRFIGENFTLDNKIIDLADEGSPEITHVNGMEVANWLPSSETADLATV
jgi:HD-GYP domain-containing protein (c-di-GMP phosphodiesterase class II)